MKDSGMTATAKHFPGHGRDIGDSHLVQPVDERSLDEIKRTDLKPFAELIKKGKLDAVMSAHITYSKVDPEHTAGMSTVWLQDILRGQLEFDGIIVSDCLAMQGAKGDNYLSKTEEALKHGDVALLCNVEPKVFKEVLNGLEDKYYADEVTQYRYAKWTSCTEEKLEYLRVQACSRIVAEESKSSSKVASEPKVTLKGSFAP